MAESEARTKTVKEYEQKLVDMEKRYQEKMREEVSGSWNMIIYIQNYQLTFYSK